MGGRRIKYQETSRDAWTWFQKFSGELDGKIITALDEAGEAGLICQHIEAKIGQPHEAVSGNLRHLVERGIIKPTDRRGKTRSGRSAIIWVARWHSPPTGDARQLTLIDEK